MDLPETIAQIAEANASVSQGELNSKKEELALRKRSWHERFVDFQQDQKIRLDTPLPELAQHLREQGYRPLFSPDQLDMLYMTACPSLDKANTKELICGAFLSEWEQYKASINTPHLRRELGKIGASLDSALKVVNIRNVNSNLVLNLAPLESYSQLNLGVLNMNPNVKPAVHEHTAKTEAKATSAAHAKRTAADYTTEIRLKLELGALYQSRDDLMCRAPLADPLPQSSPLTVPNLPSTLTDHCWKLPDVANQLLNGIVLQHASAVANRAELSALQTTLERESRMAQKARDTAMLFLMQKLKHIHSKWSESQRHSLLLDKYQADIAELSRLEPAFEINQIDQKLRESMILLSHWMQDRFMMAMESKKPIFVATDHTIDPLFFRNVFVAQIRLVQWNFLTQCFNELVQGRKQITKYNQEYVFNTVKQWVDERVASEIDDTKVKSDSLDSEWDSRITQVCVPWNKFFKQTLPFLVEQSRVNHSKALNTLRHGSREVKLPAEYTRELRDYVKSKLAVLDSKSKQDTRLQGVHTESIDHMVTAVHSWKILESSSMFYQYWADIQAAEAFIKLKAKLLKVKKAG